MPQIPECVKDLNIDQENSDVTVQDSIKN